MTLIELPHGRGPRIFIEPAADLPRRVARALSALGGLRELDALPGLDALSAALIAIAAELHDGDENNEPAAVDESDEETDAADLPLFAGLFARPP